MAYYCQCGHPQLKHLYGGYGGCNEFKCVCDKYVFRGIKTNCDFCEKPAYFVDENNEAYCRQCCDDDNERALSQSGCLFGHKCLIEEPHSAVECETVEMREDYERSLESATADDFNSSATSKDGGILERFG